MNDRDLRDHASSEMIAADDSNVSGPAFNDKSRPINYDSVSNSRPQAWQAMRQLS